MTARVTTLKGADAGRYYTDGPGGYYLDGDEPPGRWLGRGAGALGLTGEIDDDAFLAVVDGRHPHSGVLLGTRHTERTVRGFDVTFSAPKSVSVLYAVGEEQTRGEVLAAHDAAVDAVFGWIEGHAHCRHRLNGEVWTVDVNGLVAAAFRQHTSRAHDPQLHTHLVIANRVLAPDGGWLALDARTLKCDQRTVSALYGAALRAELTGRLGVRWEPVVNGQAEIVDAPDEVLALFSQRTRQLERRRDAKLERFTETMGRQPTARERWMLEREAAVESRPSKTSEQADELHQHWAAELRGLGYEPDTYTSIVTNRARPLTFNDRTDRDVIDAGASALCDAQSVWRPAEITREVAAAFPTALAATAGETVDHAETLACRAQSELMVDISRPVPSGAPLRRDGRPVTEGDLDRLLSTQAILDQEEHVLALAERWTQPATEQPAPPVSAAREPLTPAQQRAATAVAGHQRLVLVVGPAGTGKTTAMRPAVAQLHATGRACFGVAPSATAAEVLAADTGIDADTLDKLLIEHRLDRPPTHRYDLPHGATVIVDEAAMIPTGRLAELFHLADTHGWRLALLGDPMQFSAVGRAGMFGLLTDTTGAVELETVHRFDATWEQDASLRLRRGDTDVVAIYDRHGRLRSGTPNQMAAACVAAWRHATLSGHSAAMMAPSRQGVALLNELAQAARITAGELDTSGPQLRVGDATVYIGDLVATRRNDRTLRTDRGHMIKNRDHWTITHIHHDALTLTGPTGQVVVPADYTATDVELAYAETSHASQGRTVDNAYLYLDGPTDTAGIYVPLTRGRDSNEAFVVLNDERTPAEVIADNVAHTWIDQPATTLRHDWDPTPPSHANDNSDAGRRTAQRAPRRAAPTSSQLTRMPPRPFRHPLTLRQDARSARSGSASWPLAPQPTSDALNASNTPSTKHPCRSSPPASGNARQPTRSDGSRTVSAVPPAPSVIMTASATVGATETRSPKRAASCKRCRRD